MIRELVVDDHSIVRVGLQRLLEQSADIEVFGVAERGERAVVLDAELEPDVVLMDPSMPGLSGVESGCGRLRMRPHTGGMPITVLFDDCVILRGTLPLHLPEGLG